MSGIVGGINLRSSGLVNISSATDGQIFTGTGVGLPVGFEAAAGGGKILQVLQADSTAVASSTSTSFADITDITKDITPTATTSKILVIASLTLGSQSGWRSYVSLVRDSTEIWIGDAGASRPRVTRQVRVASGDAMKDVPIMYLDPNTPGDTTTAITYKVQYKTEGSGSAVYLNRSWSDNSSLGARAVSSIIVMEIGA